MPYVRCPKCAIRSNLEAKKLEKTIECRFCQTSFPAIRQDAPDEFEDDESPKSRRANEKVIESNLRVITVNGDLTARESPHPAYSRIRRPALALSCISAIGLVLCLSGGLAIIHKGSNIYTHARVMRTGGLYSPFFNTDKVNGVHLMVYGSILALLGSFLHLFILTGAIKVIRLRGFGWGYTAAGLGISSMFLWALGIAIVANPAPWIGGIGLNGLITSGISLWLIFTMNSDVIIEAIRENRIKSL